VIRIKKRRVSLRKPFSQRIEIKINTLVNVEWIAYKRRHVHLSGQLLSNSPNPFPKFFESQYNNATIDIDIVKSEMRRKVIKYFIFEKRLDLSSKFYIGLWYTGNAPLFL
jgi:hypothetical protein